MSTTKHMKVVADNYLAYATKEDFMQLAKYAGVTMQMKGLTIELIGPQVNLQIVITMLNKTRREFKIVYYN